MYLSYGSYNFLPGEANLLTFGVRKRRSARGFSVANVVFAGVAGEFCLQPGQDQYDLSIKIQNLLDNLQDGYDLTLKHDDGTPTPHRMISSDPLNITGNQVDNIAFSQNHNGEYSTGRNFSFNVTAEFSAAASLILNYQETIQHIGTTGPRYEWRINPYFGPTVHQAAPSSLQRITQTGYADSLGTWLIPPGPILPAPFEIEQARGFTRTTPKRYPQGVEAYRLTWSYTYIVPAIFPAFPTGR